MWNKKDTSLIIIGFEFFGFEFEFGSRLKYERCVN